MSGWGNAKSKDDEDTFGSPDPMSARSGIPDDDVASLYGATPFNTNVVNEPPPPYGQQGSPKAANEFISVAVSTSQVAPDARGKQVIWYTFTARTLTHRWSVSKRFSDCAQFHDTIKRMKLHDYKTEVTARGGGGGSSLAATTPRGTSMSNTSFGYFSSSMEEALASGGPEGFDVPPSFPSKFHHLRGSHSAEFVEKRRKALDSYFKGTLWFLQQLGLAAVGVARKPYAGVLRAAFAVMVDFLRTSSQTHGAIVATADLTSHHQLEDFEDDSATAAAIASFRGGPMTSSGPMSMMMDAPDVPRSKVILEPGVRYTIVLFLPGVLLKEVFVETGSTSLGKRGRPTASQAMAAANDRTVTVGGTWNCNINGLQSLRDQGVFSPAMQQHNEEQQERSGSRSDTDGQRCGSSPTEASVEPSEEGDGSVRRSILKRSVVPPLGPSRKVIADSLPRGDFEMRFEIPNPFEKAHWYSEYDGGVLLLMWDAPV